MERKYFVSAVAYDSKYIAMDYDYDFAMCDTYEEAKRYYDKALLDMEVGASDCCRYRYKKVAYWNLRIELCECYDTYIECIDILDDCHIKNNYNGYLHYKKYLRDYLDVLSEYHSDLEPNKSMNISDLLELFFFWAEEYNDNYFQEMKEDTEEAQFLKRNWEEYTK